MKGLLYKEWCLNKKSICLFALIALVFSVLGLLVFLSMICGNLKGVLDPDSTSMLLSVFTHAPYIIALSASAVCNASVCSDYESGFMKLTHTLPLTSIQKVSTKYIFAFAIMCASFVFGICNAFAMHAMARQDFTGSPIKTMLLFLLVAVILNGIFIPISYLLKKSRSVSTFAAVAGFSCYIFFGLFSAFYAVEKYGDDFILKPIEIFKDLRSAAPIFTLPVIAVITAISIYFSSKIYNRRDRTC